MAGRAVILKLPQPTVRFFWRLVGASQCDRRAQVLMQLELSLELYGASASARLLEFRKGEHAFAIECDRAQVAVAN